MVSGFLFFLLAAVFSLGYFHPDEHFQILEFANFKLGAAPLSDLPWEFRERIRPSLQPTLAYLFIKAMHLAGLQNPFQQVLVLRMMSAFLSAMMFIKLADRSAGALPSKDGREVLLSLTFLLWFMPYLQVRYSSECWSGICFLAAVYFLMTFADRKMRRPSALFIAGGCLGLSFFFRFQMGFAILGLFAWLISRGVKPRELSAFVAGGMLAGAACVALDCWFYGGWVFTPYQYFEANLLEHRAAVWGISPWWYYFSEFLVVSIPPISALLAGLFVCGVFLQRRHLFFWALAPYLIAHMLVGHKELRFLFPMVFPFLFFVAAGWIAVRPYFSKHLILKIALNVSLASNFLLLLYRSLAPAQEAVSYYHFLYRYAQNQPVTLFTEASPAFRLVGLDLNFYTPKNIETVVLRDYPAWSDSVRYKPRPGDLLLVRSQIPPALGHYRPERVFSILPGWVLQYNFNHWQDRSRIWSIYRF